MVLIAGCGGGDGSDEEPPRGTGSAPGESGGLVIPAGDPRLQDLTFLRSLPPSADVDIAIGNVFLAGGELDSALVAYRSATERNPDSFEAWNYLGICLARMDRFDEADAAYHRALDLDAFTAETHINIGNLHYRRGDLEHAETEYRLAAAIDSTDVRIWLNLGMVLAQQGEENRAILAYKRAEKVDPTGAEAPEQLGWIYYDRELYKGALECWTRALARDPSNEGLRSNVESLEAWAESTRVR
jgi:Flp pilus assembly protein TadD